MIYNISTKILLYGGESYGTHESSLNDTPIAIEKITEDKFGIYQGNYLMIVKEEQSNYLTGYVINPSGQIIMDIGLHPDGNNTMINALENLFGFDLNKDGFKGGLNEGITWMDEIHIAKKCLDLKLLNITLVIQTYLLIFLATINIFILLRVKLLMISTYCIV